MQYAFDHWNINTTTPIFLRIDGNVPHKDGIITHPYRLQQALSTIQALYQRGCPIVLATHIGRPGGTYNSSDSTAMIATWLSRHGYNVEHIPLDKNVSITEYMNGITPQPRTISVLENMRFFPGEKDQNKHFIQALAESATYYINDAWGMMHRTDSSVFSVAQTFARTHRSYGHLVQKERSALDPLRNTPDKPYMVLSGGAKVASKLPIIEKIIQKEIVNQVMIMPGMAGTFLKAQGYNIGQSLCEDAYVQQAQRIIQTAHNKDIHLDIPTDVYITRGSWESELIAVNVDEIPSDGIAIASGPQTLDRYAGYIADAATIFLNGPMGDISHFHTIQPFKQLLSIIADASAYRVAGGGDSVAIIHKLAYDPFDFYSTGGGSTLAYISDEPLPALSLY